MEDQLGRAYVFGKEAGRFFQSHFGYKIRRGVSCHFHLFAAVVDGGYMCFASADKDDGGSGTQQHRGKKNDSFRHEQREDTGREFAHHRAVC